MHYKIIHCGSGRTYPFDWCELEDIKAGAVRWLAGACGAEAVITEHPARPGESGCWLVENAELSGPWVLVAEYRWKVAGDMEAVEAVTVSIVEDVTEGETLFVLGEYTARNAIIANRIVTAVNAHDDLVRALVACNSSDRVAGLAYLALERGQLHAIAVPREEAGDSVPVEMKPLSPEQVALGKAAVEKIKTGWTRQTKYSWKDVCRTETHIGSIDVMQQFAKKLGYPYFLWCGRVYDTGRWVDTGALESDIG